MGLEINELIKRILLNIMVDFLVDAASSVCNA